MLHDAVSGLFRRFARPCFRIHGRANYEPDWHVIDIYASHRRDFAARWSLWRRTCITWTANVIAVGWDFAEAVLQEQSNEPASRTRPLTVAGGCSSPDWRPRVAVGASSQPSPCEVLAHECGHTGQGLRRLGGWDRLVVGDVHVVPRRPATVESL